MTAANEELSRRPDCPSRAQGKKGVRYKSEPRELLAIDYRGSATVEVDSAAWGILLPA
jgi:hypothetical protein